MVRPMVDAGDAVSYRQYQNEVTLSRTERRRTNSRVGVGLERQLSRFRLRFKGKLDPSRI